MSMSTGDVRQPSGKLSAKAVAADDKKPDAADAGKAAAGASRTGAAKSGSGAAKSGSGAGKAGAGAGKAGAGAGKAGAGAGKAGASRAGAGKGGGKPGAGKSVFSTSGPGRATAGGGKGRKPLAPVKVSQGRNWGPLMMFGGAGLVAILIIGFAVYALMSRPDPSKWRERAAAIPGISVFLESNPEWFEPPPDGNHKPGSLPYPATPPAGGTHNGRWQSCMGDVFPAEIPKEQAVHSLEHGAVWVTYRPDLPQDQIDRLAERVRDKEFLFMSPFPGLDRPISLQAWGYQLKVDDAGDGRIDEFIESLRRNATQEPNAGCQGGITDTGSVPLDLPSTG